ncbi:hypothetical protein EVAR_81235_1 [Eumeta japonica]|uniref:Uncharacterized protein n=1 Tax=Eumeta variegata TaxID=151549 RepID=A0A4C1V0X4_EUMVA|nr:hypothetical protein EVAR_81235_1 [Eumeta japonica]
MSGKSRIVVTPLEILDPDALEPNSAQCANNQDAQNTVQHCRTCNCNHSTATSTPNETFAYQTLNSNTSTAENTPVTENRLFDTEIATKGILNNNRPIFLNLSLGSSLYNNQNQSEPCTRDSRQNPDLVDQTENREGVTDDLSKVEDKKVNTQEKQDIPVLYDENQLHIGTSPLFESNPITKTADLRHSNAIKPNTSQNEISTVKCCCSACFRARWNSLTKNGIDLRLGVRALLIIARLAVVAKTVQRRLFPRTVELFDEERHRLETWRTGAPYHRSTGRGRENGAAALVSVHDLAYGRCLLSLDWPWTRKRCSGAGFRARWNSSTKNDIDLRLGVRALLIIARLAVDEKTVQRRLFPRTVELFNEERYRLETWRTGAAYHRSTGRGRENGAAALVSAHGGTLQRRTT